ncbi:MAG TPA: UvrD-helicase domain-containing protein, partial [Thermoanaerobaculia bacterium]|nr:UvrD-helicase domain-containing protein [Thermoanaerobaculia bacterium]
MTERPAPTPLQQAAIADTGRDLFLVAGAGTGKTTVLVDRYCDVVSDPDGPGVDGVLAFTFTERAAGELKRRIRKELLRRSEEDPARRAELRRLARDSEAGWVSTIHGFCQRLLSSHSLAAGLDPRYVVLDDSEARRISQEAFDAAFIAFASAGGDDDRLDMAAAFGVEGLREMVAASYDELRSQGHEHPVLPDVRPMQADEAARLLHEAAQRALDATAHTSGKWPETHREKMAQALQATDGRIPEEGVASGWTFKSKDDDFL